MCGTLGKLSMWNLNSYLGALSWGASKRQVTSEALRSFSHVNETKATSSRRGKHIEPPAVVLYE